MANETPKPPKIQPAIVTQEKQPYVSTFEPLPGEYHVVGLDDKGNEIPNSDFSVGERTYNRTFKDNPKFITKKKPH